MSAIRRSLLAAAALVLVTAEVHAGPLTHLKCYKASDPLAIRGAGPAWLSLDAGVLGEEYCRIVGGFRLVCVPSEATVTPPLEGRMYSGPFTPLTPNPLPVQEALAQDRLCYKIRCLGHPPINAETAFTDQFGARSLSRYKPFLMCGPAEASLCGDGNVDFGEECDDGNRVSGDCCSAGCHNEPTTQTCGSDTDGNACTAPRCDGLGACNQAGLLEPSTTACGDSDGNSCTVARCDGAGGCDQAGFLPPITTSCTDTDGNSCTQARCDGLGTCDQSGFLEPLTTTCTDVDGNECTSARCDGAGSCSQAALLAPVTTACTDVDGNVCTQARCNGAGTCNQAGLLEPVTTLCTDVDGNECTQAHCNGSGGCNQLGLISVNGTSCNDIDGNVCTVAQCQGGSCDQAVHRDLGSSCPDVDGDECNQPGCNESGVCAQDFYIRNCELGETCQPPTGICQ